MALLGEVNVAAVNCSKAIQLVNKYIFGKAFHLSELLSTSTVLNFADDAHIRLVKSIVEDKSHVTSALMAVADKRSTIWRSTLF